MSNTKGAIITGGASGIGFATAKQLISEGWEVFIIDRNQNEINAACNKLEINSSNGFSCDVTNEKDIIKIIDVIYSSCDLKSVINSAGIGRDIPFLETTTDDFKKIIDVNLLGTFIVSKAVISNWIKNNKKGSVVNISSVSGILGNKGRSAYGASKGGQNLLTLVMACELGLNGIRVNAVAPGPIDTPMAKQMHTKQDRSNWTDHVPLGRYGSPDEIAKAVAFLASDKSSYITGQVLSVDGGFTSSGILN